MKGIRTVLVKILFNDERDQDCIGEMKTYFIDERDQNCLSEIKYFIDVKDLH